MNKKISLIFLLFVLVAGIWWLWEKENKLELKVYENELFSFEYAPEKIVCTDVICDFKKGLNPYLNQVGGVTLWAPGAEKSYEPETFSVSVFEVSPELDGKELLLSSVDQWGFASYNIPEREVKIEDVDFKGFTAIKASFTSDIGVFALIVKYPNKPLIIKMECKDYANLPEHKTFEPICLDIINSLELKP